MPGVLGGEPLPLEHVPQVTAAVLADDFNATSVRITNPPNGTGDLVVEAGPAAFAFEFVVGTIERRIAAAADVSASVLQLGVFPGPGSLRPFSQDDILFFG